MTLLIDFLLFGVLFALYCVYRKFRGRRVKLEGDIPRVAVYESEWSLLALLIHVYRMDSNMFRDLCSAPALLFLQLHKMIIALLSVLTVLAFAVLIPVYEAGTSSVSNELNGMGISRVRNDPELAIGPVVCLVAFATLAQFVVYSFFKASKEGTE